MNAKVTLFTGTLALGLCMSGFWLAKPEAQSSVYFSSDFNNPGSGGWYNFEWAWPGNGNYALTHLANGGDQGSGDGAVHIRTIAGRSQYNLGLIVSALGRSFSMGDRIYIRFRIRYDETYRFNRNGKNKLLLLGTTGTSPNSRLIIYQDGVSESTGCRIGDRDWNASGSPIREIARPRHFGLPDNGDNTYPWERTPGLIGEYGSLGIGVNVTWDCLQHSAVTYAGKASPGRPGPAGSAAPVNGWYHVQYEAVSGNGNATLRSWVNNNNQSAPSFARGGLSLGVTGWGNAQIYLGGYQDNAPSADLGFRIDDFQIGGAFDSSWYPGSSGSPAPTAPAAPTGVRIVTN